MLNRLPTRSKLAYIGVISNSHDMVCVFCFHDVEEADHVFLACPRIRLVLQEVESWLGISIPLVSNCVEHMLAWFLKVIGKLSKSNACFIRLATCWCLWWTRNKVIFNDVVVVLKEVYQSYSFILVVIEFTFYE